MNMLVAPASSSIDETEFRRIAGLLRQRAGIALPDTKRPLVYSRLARRLKALGLQDFSSYIRFVEGPEGGAEIIEMISALTTNVTSFFRERHHFEMLRNQVLPKLVSEARRGSRVRLWSAGCSSGEEPYSIAMTLLAACPEAPKLNIRILATDIDPAILAKARAGRYPEESVDPITPDMRARFFEKQDDLWHVRSSVSELITFRELNLAADWPVKGPFQVIFCRNVAIYFDRAGQDRIWAGFSERLAKGGLLCIGHSERLGGLAAEQLQTSGITAYTRL